MVLLYFVFKYNTGDLQTVGLIYREKKKDLDNADTNFNIKNNNIINKKVTTKPQLNESFCL